MTLLWNTREIAHSSPILALKRLIILHKSDLVFIAEPWISFSKFLTNLLNILCLKLFFMNNRNTLHPNLWCICSHHPNPQVVSYDDDQVSLTLSENNITFTFSTVNGSTCYRERRLLCSALHNLQFNSTFLDLSLGILTQC